MTNQSKTAPTANREDAAKTTQDASAATPSIETIRIEYSTETIPRTLVLFIAGSMILAAGLMITGIIWGLTR